MRIGIGRGRKAARGLWKDHIRIRESGRRQSHGRGQIVCGHYQVVFRCGSGRCPVDQGFPSVGSIVKLSCFTTSGCVTAAAPRRLRGVRRGTGEVRERCKAQFPAQSSRFSGTACTVRRYAFIAKADLARF